MLHFFISKRIETALRTVEHMETKSDGLNLDNISPVTDGAHVTFGNGCPDNRTMENEYSLLANCITTKYRAIHPKLVII